MSTSLEQILENSETIRFLSIKEVCSEGATCPDLDNYYFVDTDYSELDQKSKRATRKRVKVTSGLYESSGTFQIDEDTETNSAVHSPFDELYDRLPDEGKIERSLVSVQESKKISFAQRLADRLRDLYESVFEDPDEAPLIPESLINFIYFLSETPGLRYPDVTLTPINEIRAQWTTAPNRHFAVSFSSAGEARFVIFKPNSDDPERTDRFSGITAVNTLIESTKPYRILEWASE